MIVRLALKNLLRAPKRSLLVGSLLFIGVVLTVVGNSLFETAGIGLKRSFVECFTGDLFVSQHDSEVFGLLGSSTPSIGAYASIPILRDHGRIAGELAGRPEILSSVSQVSGAANLEFSGNRTQAMMFGVDGDDYFKAFPAVRILDGTPLRTGRPGIMLSKSRIADIEAMTGRRPVIGDLLLLSVFTDMGFQLREAPLTGIFDYPAMNDVLERIAYVDADTLRSLFGMNSVGSGGFVPDASATRLLSTDIDRMFESGDDASPVEGTENRLAEVEKQLAQNDAPAPAVPAAGMNWNFIVIRLKEGRNAGSMRRELEKSFQDLGMDAVVGDWSTAAGSAASLASGLRVAYNFGLLLLAVVVLLVVANTLVIGVLQRGPEIATMRALGASRGMIRSLLFGETMLLSMAAMFLGLAVSAVILILLQARGIPLENRLLAMVFGGDRLRPTWSLRTLGVAVLATGAVATVAWIFPVRAAMKVPPAAAMRVE